MMAQGSRIKTLSRDDGWFDGKGTADLRAWLRFWMDEEQSAGRAEEMASEEPARFGKMRRADHIAMIEAEIKERETRKRGRPRGELSNSRRVELSRLAEQVARIEARADEARHNLQHAIREALEDGASRRVVAEVVGLSPARVHALAHENPEQ
jgi:hypothetical protein